MNKIQSIPLHKNNCEGTQTSTFSYHMCYFYLLDPNICVSGYFLVILHHKIIIERYEQKSKLSRNTERLS